MFSFSLVLPAHIREGQGRGELIRYSAPDSVVNRQVVVAWGCKVPGEAFKSPAPGDQLIDLTYWLHRVRVPWAGLRGLANGLDAFKSDPVAVVHHLRVLDGHGLVVRHFKHNGLLSRLGAGGVRG